MVERGSVTDSVFDRVLTRFSFLLALGSGLYLGVFHILVFWAHPGHDEKLLRARLLSHRLRTRPKILLI